MCELAFNINGERFTPPVTATNWRVRRLKPGGRGLPDVVFGEDGAPLVPSIETDLADFRRLVGNEPGRYRLDPIDADHKPCEGAVPAYLQISGGAPAPAPVETAGRSGDAHIDLIRDVVKTNSEMVKTISERFAQVMQSAAELIRAADGAGMPRREPTAELRNADVDDEGDDDEGDEDPAPVGGLVGLLREFKPIVDMINMIVSVNGGAKGGGAGPAPVNGARNAAPHDGAAKATGRAASAGDGAREPKAEASEPAAEPSKAEPFDIMTHLRAIERLLNADELQAVRARVAKMPPLEMQNWCNRIAALNPEQAAEVIRAEMAKKDGAL